MISKAHKLVIALSLMIMIFSTAQAQTKSNAVSNNSQKPIILNPEQQDVTSKTSVFNSLNTNEIILNKQILNKQYNRLLFYPTLLLSSYNQLLGQWYYERALIYYLQEKNGKATIELYKSIEKDPNNINANYLLGLLLKDRNRWEEASEAFFRVVDGSIIEHIPARLNLALALSETGKYSIAISNLEKIADTMKLDKSFRSRLNQLKIDASTNKAEAKKTSKIDIKLEAKDVISDIEQTLFDTPEKYALSTTALGLVDPLVYNQLAELYDEEENTPKSLEVLNEFLKKRGGFSPGVLAQVGAIYQKQNRTTEALVSYEQVIKQLKALGFSEQRGDFSTEELQTLKAQAKNPSSSSSSSSSDKTNKKSSKNY